ncbi:MAG TPA: 4-alpha-glucanotransferase [Candidatus Obscuribacterales bacterium]
MPFPRSSGVLLHPTSFPGRFGMGDMGPAAYDFIDFLQETGQQIWQVLPLGPTGHGNSPYMSYSSMAGNHLLISLERLRDDGLLTQADLDGFPHFSEDGVEFDAVQAAKLELLEKAAAAFESTADDKTRADYILFCHERAFWLDDYAFFMALKRAHGGASWSQWDPAIASREAQAMESWHSKLSSIIAYHKFFQFEFSRQWTALKAYANERQIQIVGDMPIYVAHDSADVWAFPHNFMLDPDTLEPSEMAGVPPDYFSETGQLWGNPTYNWEMLEKLDFRWWIQRLRSLLDYVDLIRIDHFRGFEAYWAVPAGETTAVNGEWVKAPGEAFFNTVKAELGALPIMAEDLGVITPEVEALRDQFGFPGMKILQFAFGGGADNPYLPFNFERNWVVYTGTHDNDTTLGWYEQAPDHERDRTLQYLGGLAQDGMPWGLIRLALSSVANQAIIPLQDLLSLGTQARMNTPGKPDGNWGWRYRSDMLTREVRDRLMTLTKLYGRSPKSEG